MQIKLAKLTEHLNEFKFLTILLENEENKDVRSLAK